MSSGQASCLYFAYGSNLDHDRLVDRVGPVDLTAARPARLHGHRLSFTKRSRTAGGAATIGPAPDAVVEGVLWPLTERQLLLLDGIEGVPQHYLRHRVELDCGPAPLEGWTYVAHPDRVADGLRPTAAYLGHLLRGARWLSPGYLEGLRAVETDG